VDGGAGWLWKQRVLQTQCPNTLPAVICHDSWLKAWRRTRYAVEQAIQGEPKMNPFVIFANISAVH